MGVRVIIAALLGLVVSAPAAADSFTPPTLAVAESPNKAFRVTVIPTALSCAPMERDCRPAARAVIELVRGGQAQATGVVALVNKQAPGEILVSDDGLRLVTIDDYASKGFGPNVIVIYRRDGSIVRRMALADILPPTYINGLPRTASMLGWGAGHRMRPGDDHKAEIGIFLADASGGFNATRVLYLELDLDTGQLAKPSGPAWSKAQVCARATGWAPPRPGELKQREEFKRKCLGAR